MKKQKENEKSKIKQKHDAGWERSNESVTKEFSEGNNKTNDSTSEFLHDKQRSSTRA